MKSTHMLFVYSSVQVVQAKMCCGSLCILLVIFLMAMHNVLMMAMCCTGSRADMWAPESMRSVATLNVTIHVRPLASITKLALSADTGRH